MNKRLFISTAFALFFIVALSATSGNVYVDKNGVLRYTATNEEATFYGVNYTLPFAHAYRAISYIGKSHKEAIDKDVYHIARLGMNAYRIHIWDVEITDKDGNLIENEHLDLLDYLIYKLEERGISILITAQTNFGNGYPERNINTGGYSYHYEKCRMHDTENCIKAQEKYAMSLAGHINKYTGKSYSTDDAIIAIEINNEPCHSGSADDATRYINRMVRAFRKGGFKKPLLYNVSHNLDNHTDAFFKSDIQGTTYQWYPTGLVAGHERKGNFLPNVDNYDISFKNVRNFDKMCKVIYEFDPGDVLDSYLYPAITRTFRSAGFQWITQFAYDPIDIAWANTEYQTHYLNLAYTPQKAISMKIAAEVAKNVRIGEKFAKYPQDTIFKDFMVSYNLHTSTMNSGKKYIYSNSTATMPKDFGQLEEVAGVGNSPIVRYAGTGAYFIDRIGDGLWRLEILPDVFIVADPFGKPSLSRKVGEIIYNEHDIWLKLPKIGSNYAFKGINNGNQASGTASAGSFKAKPGVYLIGNHASDINSVDKNGKFRNITLSEYAAPEKTDVRTTVLHSAKPFVPSDAKEITISAKVIGSKAPDSVMVYPRHISFWNDKNDLYRMNRSGAYECSVNIPLQSGFKEFEYNIVVFEGNEATTYPQCIAGTPLTWDFGRNEYYMSSAVGENDAIVLVTADKDMAGIETATIPDYSRIKCGFNANEPMGHNSMTFQMRASNASTKLYLRKYVGDILCASPYLTGKSEVCISVGNLKGIDSLDVALLTNKGITYRKRLKVYENGIYRIGVSELRQDETALIPAPYPIFLKRYFQAEIDMPFSIADVEQIEVSTAPIDEGTELSFDLTGIWLE
ncbi:MAG: hypothetical protein ACI4AN_08925 [Muribaculaceae bacterium]